MAFAFGFFSCNKEEMKPVVVLANDLGYQVNDTILAVGDTIKVRLDLTWNGTHKIKEVVIKKNDQLVGNYQLDIDTGRFDITIIKGLAETEIWDFTVNDEGGNSSTISLILTKDPNSLYGGLKYFDSVYLGSQSNINRPGFMSLSSAAYYTLDGAFANQSKIDLLFYYNESDKATLASPGADIPEGVFSSSKAPNTWTVRNSSYFLRAEMSPDEFHVMYHDGFIIENFDLDIATKKASNLVPGDIYLFQMINGKKGIFYVISMDPAFDGEINIAIKIQE